MLVINKKGTFIDGLQISDVTIRDFNLDYRSDEAAHGSPMTMQNTLETHDFRKSFGNYGQDIKVSINTHH